MTENAGLSQISSDNSCPDTNVGNLMYFSGNGGLFMEQRLNESTLLGMRASLVQINGGERIWEAPVYTYSGENRIQTGTTTYRSNLRNHYLSLPI